MLKALADLFRPSEAAPSPEEVGRRFLPHFAAVFGRELVAEPWPARAPAVAASSEAESE